MLAGLATAIAVVFAAPSVRAVVELRGFLPQHAEWIGAPVSVGRPFPALVWQSFQEPSFEDASALLIERAELLATTRTGDIQVFRAGDRTLYLARYEGISRLEMQLSRPCRPLATPFPARPDDVFLQFGSTPGRAVERGGAEQADFELDPCPAAGFWATDSDKRVSLFTGLADRRITYRLDPTAHASGAAVGLGPGLPAGYLGHGPIPEIAWRTGNTWHLYSGTNLTQAELLTTACRSMRPNWLCRY